MLAALLLIHSVTIPGTELDVKLATQVGQPYDAASVAKDVKTLWSIGRFRDVSVETVDGDAGTDVIFHVTPEPQYPLNELQLRPHAFGLEISLPPGTLITQPRANDLALTAQRQLVERGYARASVIPTLQPLPNGKANVFLDIKPGEALRLKALGDPSLKPPKWYSPGAIDNHASRLRSLWATKGYFDVRVTTSEQLFEKKAVVEFHVEPGQYYHPIDTKRVCGELFKQRRASERQGVLDFQANLAEDGITTSAELGRQYTVGRIRFVGHPHYTDIVIRKHFLLDEGVPFDSWLLRQSVVRLNQSGMFELLDEHHVRISSDATTGIADVTVYLTERKRGAWSFSGPLPLSGSVSMRLPAWGFGSGVGELSTYTASFNALAYSTILEAAANRRFFPVFSIDRPFTPAGGWLSGFSIAPQLGPQLMVIHYISTQILQRLGPKLQGTRAPDMVVSLQRPTGGDTPVLCEAPKPRLHGLRMGAGLALQFVRTLTY